MSDYMDLTLGLGYATGSAILVVILLTILGVWWLSEKSFSVTDVQSRRAELFYWAAILIFEHAGHGPGRLPGR